MVPIAALLPIVDAALLLIEKVSPHIKEALSKGEITKEQQAKLKDRIDRIRLAAGKFTRP